MSQYKIRIQNALDGLLYNAKNSYNFDVEWLVYRYLCEGQSRGIKSADLLDALREYEAYYEMANQFLDNEFDCGPPLPELRHGQMVEVILNERNHTQRRGAIIDMVWHHKDAKWYYFIRQDGRKILKRYAKEDLRMVTDQP